MMSKRDYGKPYPKEFREQVMQVAQLGNRRPLLAADPPASPPLISAEPRMSYTFAHFSPEIS